MSKNHELKFSFRKIFISLPACSVFFVENRLVGNLYLSPGGDTLLDDSFEKLVFFISDICT